MNTFVWNANLWDYYFELVSLKVSGKPMSQSQINHLALYDKVLEEQEKAHNETTD